MGLRVEVGAHSNQVVFDAQELHQRLEIVKSIVEEWSKIVAKGKAVRMPISGVVREVQEKLQKFTEVSSLDDQQKIMEEIRDLMTDSAVPYPLIKAQTLLCGHTFNKSTLERFFKIQNNCPMCRDQVLRRDVDMTIQNICRHVFTEDEIHAAESALEESALEEKSNSEEILSSSFSFCQNP